MKTHIVDTLNLLDNENILDQNVRWDFLKYEIRKFTIDFSKALSKNEKQEVSYLEKKLKDLECDLSNTKTRDQYLDCKDKLENIYKKKKLMGLGLEVNVAGMKVVKNRVNFS